MESVVRTKEEACSLQSSILFSDMRPEELDYALAFFHAHRRSYDKGEILNPVGEPLPFF